VHLSGILNAAPEEVVMVQSPQRFRDLTKCDLFGSRNITFFDKILCALGSYGVSCFVGTGAIFKRSALEANKYVPTSGVTEDVALSLELQLKGFRTIYTRKICAFGTSPQNGKELLTQRMRWIWGGFQAAAKYHPVSQPNLSWHAKLFWLNTYLWYICSPILIAIVMTICAGILTGAPIISHGTYVQALYIYIPLSRLAWVLYMYPVDQRDALIQATETLVSDFYFNHRYRAWIYRWKFAR
jgi:cellulose synthase/poly-beta-1,6-N-acetylglucosamine synthase-like glycosyltransferase